VSVPVPRGRLGWAFVALILALLASAVAWSVLAGKKKEGLQKAREAHLAGICAEERKACEDLPDVFEGIVARHDERCVADVAARERTISALQDRVKPCCPEGCEKELVYKDWLFESQKTYYKKWIKVHCGKWVEPTEAELRKFAEEEDDDGDDGDEGDTRW